YLFWQRGCPHCEDQIRLLASIEVRAADVRVHYLELHQNPEPYVAAARRPGMSELAVPLPVVGGGGLVSAPDGNFGGPTPESLIAECRRNACADMIAPLAQEYGSIEDRGRAMREAGVGREAAPPVEPESGERRMRLPLIGEVDPRMLSLPVL